MRREAKRAVVWLGIAAAMGLVAVLANPLLVVFGGLVFGALLDGGARLIGKVLPLPRGLRVAIVMVAAVAFVGWFVVFAGGQIIDQAALLPGIIQGQSLRIIAWANHHGFAINTRFQQQVTAQALSSISQLSGFVGGLLGGATTGFLIVVLGIYMAIDPHPYRRGVAWMLPVSSRPFFEETLAEMGHTLRRLLLGRLIGMVVEGVTIALALRMGDVPLSSVLGLIAGLLAFLPNIGAAISGLLMLLVGLSVGSHTALYCVGVYVVVQGVDGNIIVPMVAKRTADLAPALVMGMQLVMGVLFGILGLALADPLLAMGKVLLEKIATRAQPAAPPPALSGA